MLRSVTYKAISLSRKAVNIFAPAIILIIGVTVLQDYLQSRRNNYSFYISESILFGTFWMLFLPITLLQLYLFKKFNYTPEKGSALKIAVFILLASCAHIILFAVLVFCLSKLFFDHTYSVNQIFSYTISEDIYKYILIYGTIGFLYFRKEIFLSDNPLKELPKIPTKFLDKIIVGAGRNNIAIATEDIIYISSSSPYIVIHTKNKKYLHSETLKSIHQKLNTMQFVRIHKSTIINLEKVVSYKSRLNGDYDILLDNQLEVRLSRNYVSTFRLYFEKA